MNDPMRKHTLRKRDRLRRRLRHWKSVAIVTSAVGVSAVAAVPYGQPVDLLEPGLPGPEQVMALSLMPLQDAAPVTIDNTEYDTRLIENGEASFYGAGLVGNATANGETFNPSDLTAAHPTLPFGSMVRVTNDVNGREVTVRINDRGPFVGERVIDLSEEAARKIGMIGSGTAPVTIELLTARG